MQRVVISVVGGVAYEISAPADVEVVILDLDNLKEEVTCPECGAADFDPTVDGRLICACGEVFDA
jgi:hypothetical protein